MWVDVGLFLRGKIKTDADISSMSKRIRGRFALATSLTSSDHIGGGGFALAMATGDAEIALPARIAHSH